MKLSVIVPFYNSEETLGRCLESIYKSDYTDFEVLAVDDRSTDKSVSIAGQFPCKLLKTDKKGEAYTRNKGIENATGEIIVFVDSDVVIRRDTFERIVKNFRDTSIAAQTGTLSKEHPNKNFFSQYKNLYMNYILGAMPKYVSFLYGSIFAVRKQFMEYFDTKAPLHALDTDLGARLHKRGYRILLDKELEVTHLKRYSFISFIKNDIRIPLDWAFIFVRRKRFKLLFKQKRFAHARLNQITGVLLSPLAFIALLFSFKNPSWLGLFSLLSFLILLLNAGLLNFLRKEKGILFFLKSVPIAYLDAFIMFCGIVSGAMYYFFFSNINKCAILNLNKN